MSEDRFASAVAGEVLAAAGARQALLQSIADVARANSLSCRWDSIRPACSDR